MGHVIIHGGLSHEERAEPCRLIGWKAAALQPCGEAATGRGYAEAWRQRCGGGAGGRYPCDAAVWLAAAAARIGAEGICAGADRAGGGGKRRNAGDRFRFSDMPMPSCQKSTGAIPFIAGGRRRRAERN